MTELIPEKTTGLTPEDVRKMRDDLQEQLDRLAGKDTRSELQKLVDGVVADRSQGSFRRRNPGLGKMINCPVCGDRHFSVRVCTPWYAVEAPVTRRGLTPLSERKKRYHPHPNKIGLLILEATVRHFDNYGPFMNDQTVAMKISRANAAREVRNRLKQKANQHRNRQKASRRVNREN